MGLNLELPISSTNNEINNLIFFFFLLTAQIELHLILTHGCYSIPEFEPERNKQYVSSLVDLKTDKIGDSLSAVRSKCFNQLLLDPYTL